VPRLALALGIVLFWLCALVVRRAHAAPFDLTGNDWEGCSELVRLARSELGDERVVATTRIDFHELSADDGLLVLYPKQTLDVDDVSKFMRAGGRAILMDDFGRGDSLLEHFGIERVASPRRPVTELRHNPAFALAEPASAHPVVSDVTSIVTNHPTGLTHHDLSPVLKIRAQDGESDVTIAVAGLVGQGRLLAVGDPSIVMNSMLRYAGNKSFAHGIIRYAVDQDTWGKRGGRLFILSGTFDQVGTFGADKGALNEALRSLRAAIEAVHRDGAPNAIAYAAAIALGLALVVWVGSRAGKLHRAVAPHFVRPIPTVVQGGVAGHAAVIAAPQTSRVLAVLELKSALEEYLSTVLGLERIPPWEELVARAREARLLDTEGLHTLRELLLRMSNAEAMVVSQRSGTAVKPIRDSEVVAIAKMVHAIISQAERERQVRSHGAPT